MMQWYLRYNDKYYGQLFYLFVNYWLNCDTCTFKLSRRLEQGQLIIHARTLSVYKQLNLLIEKNENMYSKYWSIFLAFDFCCFCVVIRFFHPHHKGQWPPTSKDFHTRFYPLHLFPYLNSWKRASISLF